MDDAGQAASDMQNVAKIRRFIHRFHRKEKPMTSETEVQRPARFGDQISSFLGLQPT